MKITKKIKEIWIENRVPIGYFSWIGVPIMALIWYLMSIFSLGIMIEAIIFHLIGLFLVAKHHWFKKDEE